MRISIFFKDSAEPLVLNLPPEKDPQGFALAQALKDSPLIDAVETTSRHEVTTKVKEKKDDK